MRLTQEYTHDIAHRFRFLHWILAAFFFILVGRLYYLQIYKGEDYRLFSHEYSMRELRTPAARGLILDRNGVVLASNRPSQDVIVIPQFVLDWNRTREALSQILSLPIETVDQIWQRRLGKPSYRPLLVASNVSLDVISQIKANQTPWFLPGDRYDLRGVEIYDRATRSYKHGNLTPHALGYLKEVSEAQLSKLQTKHPDQYFAQAVVGASGVEEYRDLWLRGRDGQSRRIVDARGREIDYPGVTSQLTDVPSLPGATLQLTIDERLQQVAHDGFAGRSGALVALDPQTGAVLALYSSPTFDLTKLSNDERHGYWAEVVTDAKRILYNRAIQGTYPPGSTFKMVTGIAALAEGLVTPDEKVTCHGGLEVAGRRFSCWNKGGHGAMNIVTALTQSCDVYFYTMGLRLGVDRLAHYAQLLGLGRPTGIDLPNERGGLIPTSDWKLQRFGRAWVTGDMPSIAIGQGYDALTPLQDALMVAMMVNGGKRIVPHVLERVVAPDQQELYRWQPSTTDSLNISPDILALIRRGMEGVVNGPGGTARRLETLKLKIAGKTGTAQTVGYDSKVQLGDHAWFVGYAPYDDPKIVVAVIVEFAGHGGTQAAPIVGAVIKAYLAEPQTVEVSHAPR